MNDTALSSDNPLRFKKNSLYKRVLVKTIKRINNKTEENKAQYNLDRQTSKISAISSGNVSKFDFLTGKHVLPEKDWLEKAATLKRFEYLPLDKELKNQTIVAEKPYQDFDKVFNYDERE